MEVFSYWQTRVSTTGAPFIAGNRRSTHARARAIAPASGVRSARVRIDRRAVLVDPDLHAAVLQVGDAVDAGRTIDPRWCVRRPEAVVAGRRAEVDHDLARRPDETVERRAETPTAARDRTRTRRRRRARSAPSARTQRASPYPVTARRRPARGDTRYPTARAPRPACARHAAPSARRTPARAAPSRCRWRRGADSAREGAARRAPRARSRPARASVWWR